MFNLYQILTGAQGGQALDNLAAQFGITREQADEAVKSLVPALSTAFMTKAAQPGGINEIAGVMHDDQHKLAYADPTAAQDASIQNKGYDIAGSIFGSSAVLDQVVVQAARHTGLSSETLRGMMPVIVSMVLGGVATTMHNQGLGGLLGQLASSGLGGMFGGSQPAGPAGSAGQEGGFGGMFGSILGSFLGGGQQHGSQEPPAPEPNPTRQTPQSPFPQAQNADWMQNPAIQAGMDALSKMLQPGVKPPHAEPADDLGAEIDSILSDKKR